MHRCLHLLALASVCFVQLEAAVEESFPTPPQIWADYDSRKGDFKEEIVKEETKGDNYFRSSYISAYVLGEEVRVYCLYEVKSGAKKAPGLLNVHGWFGTASIDQSYVKDGWAVMSYDYCGLDKDRPHYTKFPERLSHGNMKVKPVIYTTLDGKPITDGKQTSDYLWYAIEARVLSYLEAQKEVDRNRLGAKGYSYGGTLMWFLGMDPRIKAVVAYFGIGWIQYYRDKGVMMYTEPHVEPPAKTRQDRIYLAGISPEAYVPYMTAPTLFLNGSNDHHGVCERGLESFKLFKPGVPWAFALQARGRHDTNLIGQDTKMWLEKYVLNKEVFWPAHPASKIQLDGNGYAELVVTPASPERVTKVEVYGCLKNNSWISRVWRDLEPVHKGTTWVTRLPVMDTKDYIFTYANVIYDTTLVLSTDFNAAIPAKLGNAKASEQASSMLYPSDGGLGMWSNVTEVEGKGGIKGLRCTANNKEGITTEKMSDPKWKAPEKASLGLKVQSAKPQVIRITAGLFSAEINIPAGNDWQTVVIPSQKLVGGKDDQKPMKSWAEAGKLQIKAKDGSDLTQVVFAQIKWESP